MTKYVSLRLPSLRKYRKALALLRIWDIIDRKLGRNQQ